MDKYPTLVDSLDIPIGSDSIENISSPRKNHTIVEVSLFHHGNLILQKRSKNREDFPSLWSNTCSTSLQANESILQAAKRSIKETLGTTNVSNLTELVILDCIQKDSNVFKSTHLVVGNLNQDFNSIRLNYEYVEKIKLEGIITSYYNYLKNEEAFTPWFSQLIISLIRNINNI